MAKKQKVEIVTEKCNICGGVAFDKCFICGTPICSAHRAGELISGICYVFICPPCNKEKENNSKLLNNK